jgi:acyl-coenzyme A synthetase/AMP-(fatty) acid ligase
MVPRLWVPIPEVPKNASGKLDRNALRGFMVNYRPEKDSAPEDLDLTEVEFQLAGL